MFTAVADVAMGFLLANRELSPASGFSCLALSSSLLYTSGMVLNDVFDVEQDSQERPDRPLPAGRIAHATAVFLGVGLLVGGVAAACFAGFLQPVAGATPWRPPAVAGAICVAILLYDRWLKRTPAGPLGMGACRFLNVLLGASLAPDVAAGVLGFGPQHLVAASGVGVYIVGVTWFARTEASRSNKLSLSLATAVMMVGIATLGYLHEAFGKLDIQPPGRILGQVYWLLLGMLAFMILRRCMIAISDPSPRQVQLAVKHGILSLIMLDAAVSVYVAAPGYALGIVALLVPTFALGRWVYST